MIVTNGISHPKMTKKWGTSKVVFLICFCYTNCFLLGLEGGNFTSL